VGVRVLDGKPRRLPGVEGVWVFVIADMTMFGVLFACFVADRRQDTALFDASQHVLNPSFGAVNTIILLTSSWLVVLALDAVRKNRPRAASHLLAAALACGVAFMVSKGIDYTEKFHDDITLSTNDFYMYYFAMTGIHLAHVVAGNVVLLVLWLKARANTFNSQRPVVLECGATYWHMVDLLWIMLFPLLYLLR
jgi:nitric oxide reductase NorE protein